MDYAEAHADPMVAHHLPLLMRDFVNGDRGKVLLRLSAILALTGKDGLFLLVVSMIQTTFPHVAAGALQVMESDGELIDNPDAVMPRVQLTAVRIVIAVSCGDYDMARALYDALWPSRRRFGQANVEGRAVVFAVLDMAGQILAERLRRK